MQKSVEQGKGKFRVFGFERESVGKKKAFGIQLGKGKGALRFKFEYGAGIPHQGCKCVGSLC